MCAASCRRCTGSMRRCSSHPKPVVAAINGHAVAGGAVLAACADRRIMARDSGRIGVTEMLVGVPFPALAFEIVRFAVPPRHLPEFTLGGATYATDVALQRGWVDEVVEPDALMTRAIEAAQTLAALSPPAFAQTKMQIRQAVSERYAQSGAATDAAVTEIWTAPEALGAHPRLRQTHAEEKLITSPSGLPPGRR